MLKSSGRRSKAPLGPRHAERDEKGFTLIELLIVVSVMPIIVGAISAGLIAVISLQSSVSSRLADTSDAQVVSSTFIKDVQSATFITTSATSSPQCGSAGTQLLGLQWGNTPQDIASGSPANPSTLVSYDLVPVTGGSTTTYSLDRELCTLGNFTTPTSSTTVSYDVASTQPPPCYSSAACDPTDLVHNPQIGWTSPSALVPQSNQLLIPVVKFVIAEVKSNFTFTLVANSLSWTPAAAQSGTVGPAFSPLTLLSQASGTVLTMTGGSILTITGTGVMGMSAAFASTYDSSGFLPPDADFSASSVFTEDPNLASLTGAGLGSSTPEYYAASITDPLKSLFNSSTAPPANAALAAVADLMYVDRHVDLQLSLRSVHVRSGFPERFDRVLLRRLWELRVREHLRDPVELDHDLRPREIRLRWISGDHARSGTGEPDLDVESASPAVTDKYQLRSESYVESGGHRQLRTCRHLLYRRCKFPEQRVLDRRCCRKSGRDVPEERHVSR